jgi:hypothetical protein
MAETYIEAAFNGNDGSQEAHFFLGNHYVTFNWAANRAQDGARPATDWGIPPTFTPPPPLDTSPEPVGLEGGIKGRGGFSSFAYVFKGTDYLRLRLAPRGLDGTGTLPVWHLPGPAFAGGIDAGFNGRLSREGKGYLFRGNEYNRYDWVADRPDVTDPNGAKYPRKISNMVGMPPDFASGVSAAVEGDAKFADAGYLFRQDQYLRFQWVAPGAGEPHVDGKSQPIRKLWEGLVELLLAGKAKSKALVWIGAAQGGLAAALVGSASPVVDAALAVHFHIAPSLPLASKAPLIAQIQTTYVAVTGTLANSASNFRFRTDDQAVTDHVTAPIPAAYTNLNSNINFTEHFADRRRMARGAIVLHEAVHFTDAQSGSRTPSGALAVDIPEWYVTDAQADALHLTHQGNNAGLSQRYDLMSTADALHNPSAYAAFAQHVAMGSDTRFGDGNPGPE